MQTIAGSAERSGKKKKGNLHTYDRERQTAAETWARKLLAIMGEAASNVIPMTKGRMQKS